MKILMVAQFYAPDVGGEERHVQDLAESLAARGHSVAVATFAHPGCPAFEVMNGVRVHRIRASIQRLSFLYTTQRQHAAPIPDPEAIAGLHRVIAQEKPQIVHAHNWLLHQFTPLKKWSGAKFVVTLHDLSMACAKKTLMQGDAVCSGPALVKCIACAKEQYGLAKGAITVLGNSTLRIFERKAVDMFLPVSQDTAVRSGLIQHHLPFKVVPNFLPDARLDAIAQDDKTAQPHSDAEQHLLDKLPKENYILFAGDVRRFKGAHYLIEAYKQLHAEHPNTPPLVLAGRADLDVDCTNLPPNVISLGRLPHAVLMEARKRSLFAVAPSVGAEPFGIVIIEAMAMGQPVIASRIGGIPDIIEDGVDGILVQSGDTAALKAAMSKLIANPEHRAQLGAAAQAKVQRYRASVVMAQVEGIYGELLGEPANVKSPLINDVMTYNSTVSQSNNPV